MKRARLLKLRNFATYAVGRVVTAISVLEPSVDSFVKNNWILLPLGIAAFSVLAILGIPIDATQAAILFILAIVAGIVWVMQARTHRGRKQNTDAIFTFIDPKLRRVSYLKIHPPIDIMVEQAHVQCRILSYRFRMAAPSCIEGVLAEAARLASATSSQDQMQEVDRLRKWFEDGNFATVSEPIIASLTASNSDVYENMVADGPRYDAARKKALMAYLTKSGFHFNGPYVAVNSMKETRHSDDGLNERPGFDFTVMPTDYYTFRVISELAKVDNLREYNFPDVLGDQLTEYCAGDFKSFVHASLGVSVIVRSLEDNRLILTRRSENTGNPLDEAGKYFMSANEGLNYKDYDGDNHIRLKPIIAWVHRALREELIGAGDPFCDALMEKIRSCCLVGATLYLPNMSINLCFYVAIACSSDHIREAQVRARDGRFEASIVRESRWDVRTGLPEFSPKAIGALLHETISNGQLSDAWDEGALAATMLATLAYDGHH